MTLLAGRTALITGAGGGIGRGIALRFAEEGAAVALHCRTAVAAAEALAREIGPRAVVLPGADLTVEEDCRRLVAEAADWGGGRLDALVNNAGVQPVRALPGMPAADWRAVVDTNLTSVFACTQAAAEVMRGHGGTITHIASVEARTPALGHAHYAAAKAAVVMHARAAAQEYGPYGIRVNTVSPGLIERDGLEDVWPEGVRRWREAVAVGRLGRPEDVGDACVFLASPLASWVTGHDLVVDGGASARAAW
ncbi:SDR family NAD(P)-dependent oxidoreductase [Streptomyces antibioticus]|uniref:SDR family oxidoreductase n=1 Tax=Streptomyces antibioticus TaxID=1890 RepID=A0AAE6Y9M0_STRAT|nr:SDR family oxidoreductase [Streptomyces antibioticus]OOQ50003.1 short-chain dehydrogenase [Streptomyces antibioticus]QIT45417.1 SDR family oxidoreductase [Streptomyces antibioticus]